MGSFNINFNTFVATSNQSLLDAFLEDYPNPYDGTKNPYDGTKKWMFRFVFWLRNGEGTVKKAAIKALAIIGSILLTPLVVGGFLLKWNFNARRNVDVLCNKFQNLRWIENECRERIIKALGVEKQGVIIPEVESRPSPEEMDAKFQELKSPIFQCKGDFIAILLRDKKTQKTRVATIEKQRDGWVFKNLKSSRCSESIGCVGTPVSFAQIIGFGSCVSDLKKILKGRSPDDELALDLQEKPQEKWELKGPNILDVKRVAGSVECDERLKIIDALGGEEAVRKIPVLQKRPLSKHREAIFEKLKRPIFQSGGDFISIMIEDRDTLERKMITIKKVKHYLTGQDCWAFIKFPVERSAMSNSRFFSTKARWTLADESVRTIDNRIKEYPSDCEMLIEFLQEVVQGDVNKYRLATFS